MSDLISREKAIEMAKQFWYKPDVANALSELPSADIMECARAIKKYCTKRENCIGCPLESKDQMYLCAISHDLPDIWDLPASEEEGE